MQKILNALISLGLSDKEAKIYIALYKVGQATAYEIAKEAGVKRPTVYMLIEELRKKGLALVVPHKKKQIYIAKDPREFITEYQSDFNRNAHDLLASLPTLSRPVGQTNMLVFKGQGSLIQGLSYGLNRIKDGKIYAFYTGIGKNMKIRDEYTEHSTHIHKLGLHLQCIMPSDSYDDVFRDGDKKYGFETRRIDHNLFSPSVSVEVGGDVVKMIFHKQKEVVVIEEKGLADFYKQVFGMMWKGKL